MSSTTPLEQSVQALTDATTELLDAVNIRKAQLDLALTVVGEASGFDMNTYQAVLSARNEAVAARDQAVTVVYDGDASATPAGGKIPVADGNGKLDPGWVPNIIITDALRQSVEAQTGGRQTVIYSHNGVDPNIVTVIPRFRYEDLPFPALGTGDLTAFDTGTGSIKPEIFIGSYLGANVSGRLRSWPGLDPRNVITWDNAKAACEAMGLGWHMMTMHEWAAVALWCAANGLQPRGNTNHGQAHNATHEAGRRGDGAAPGVSSGVGHTHTGSGPATWRHDGTLAGIADLVGNVWEWQWGMKLVDGRVFAAPHNNPGIPEGGWLDTGVDMPARSGFTWVNENTVGTELTDRLLITRPDDVELTGSIWTNLDGERFPNRGGGWYYGSGAGLGALDLTLTRTITRANRGVRPAFVA